MKPAFCLLREIFQRAFRPSQKERLSGPSREAIPRTPCISRDFAGTRGELSTADDANKTDATRYFRDVSLHAIREHSAPVAMLQCRLWGE